MVQRPIVSVIIPTYNYANFISEAIDSVLNQNIPQNEIEIIVIDDGSTDNTSEVISKYKDRIKYVYQENSGKALAIKIGIDVANGKYIFNLDADDIFLPDKIQKVLSVFERGKDIVHVSHPAIYWDIHDNTRKIENIPYDIKGRKIYGKDILSFFYNRRLLFGGGSTFCARADVLKKIQIRKEIDMYIDEYLVLFTLNNGYSFFIEEPLSIWRIHSKNFSDVKYDRKKIERNMRSMEAVLSDVLNSDFENEIKVLYLLKTKVSKLAVKEALNEKSLSNILDLWLYLIRNFRVINKNIFRVIKSYTVLNRSLPTYMLMKLKQFKDRAGK